MRPYGVAALFVAAMVVFASTNAYYATASGFGHFTWASGTQGDTSAWSAWTPATDGGNFNGGRLFGWWGDGSFGGVNTQHIIAMEMTAFDPHNWANTTVALAGGAGVNTLSSWGVAGQNQCMNSNDVNNSCSGGLAPFSLRGNIYGPIHAQTDGDPFYGFRALMIVSPDHMLHWCNWANYQSGGNAGANSCDAGNWSATGDVVTATNMTYRGVSHTAIQWDGFGFNTNKMCRLVVVPWGQDTATGPVVPSGVDPAVDTTYTYEFSLRVADHGSDSTIYLHRFLTSGEPVDPAVHQHYNNGAWDTDFMNSTALDLGGVSMDNVQSHSEFYSPVAKKWFMVAGSNYLAADLPWGPFRPISTVQTPQATTNGFEVWMPHTYAETGGGAFKISHSENGHSPGTDGWNYVPGSVEWTFRPVMPGVSSGHSRGSVIR